MKAVDINGRFLAQLTPTGVQRYAAQLVQALDRQFTNEPELCRRFRLRLLAPPTAQQQALQLEHIPTVTTGRLGGHAWEQLELPREARGRLLLNLCNTAPLVSRTVVTIHDASVYAVPEAYSFAFRTWYRAMLPIVGKRSRRVVTVSEFSRGELSRWAGIPSEKVDVIHLGAEHILQTTAAPDILTRLGVQPGQYILTVGSRTPHKNLHAVTTAVSQLGSDCPPLIIAGGTNSRIFAPSGAGHPFCEAGYVTDGELRALYQHAMCFVYLSLYEGFGLPPLEAMACGCPTIVSNSASLPEVCGDAVLYCSPRDADDITAKLRVLIRDSGQRDELRRRGLNRARSFTWDLASRALLDLLERVPPA
jgi:glycosyltransferase involved in cell wall biosynthesis